MTGSLSEMEPDSASPRPRSISTTALKGLTAATLDGLGTDYLGLLTTTQTAVLSATQLNGLDALLSIVQMPKGVPVGTLAIGKAGAANAALLAAEMLATTDENLYHRLTQWRAARTQEVLGQELPA